MSWFNIVFPLTMLLFPAVFMTLIPTNRRADIDPAKARRLTVALWLATAGAIGVWLAVYALASPRLASFCWMLFFPLFFGFWGRLMRSKNPDWISTPPPDVAARSASLAPRPARSAAPQWAIWSLWILWATICIAIVLMVDWNVLLSSDAALGFRRRMGLTAVLVAGSLVVIPGALALSLRLDRREPQPLDPAGSEELVALYARRRRQRAWLFISFGWVMLLMFGIGFGAAALMSRSVFQEMELSRLMAWTGGIGGSIIGVAGGVAGTLSSIQAARINARMRELTQAGA